MTYYFTKIKWAGDEAILVNNENRENVFILTSYEVRTLIKEWEKIRI